jgi:hypothetical protein
MKTLQININDYLSMDDIKEIVKEEIKRHVRDVVGNISVSVDRDRVFISKLAKNLAKEGVQEIIPNFRDLINDQIISEIEKITLSDFFVHSFGWKSEGNKVLTVGYMCCTPDHRL